MRLSVLDQAPVTSGHTSEHALQSAVELAQVAEELGYYRMWMAEHHGGMSFASSAPEVIAAYIAAKTERIRLGSGGIMMMHYSPLKMAEVFKTLSALAPGRIDFGVGRAPGGDANAIYAMSQGQKPMMDGLYEKLQTTLQLINDETPEERWYKTTPAAPTGVTLPEAWLLGSSGNSAVQAGRMGVGYSFAQFFNGELSKDTLDTYRHHFTPSAFMEKPEINVTYLVTTAETEEEAEYLARPSDLSRLFLMRGQLRQLLSPEAANDYPLTEVDKIHIANNRAIHLVGTPKQIAAQLQDESVQYGFGEAMICSIQHTQAQRLNVYRLLAKELL
ncbi:MsnO8 family LLM class oxidoreductase [Exiguobacterium sp. SH3S1]|uniref:MsnO8 family LLM class oxidoreductase n=1 Tax=Exiguobacterium sp. SH3S1 TaxID=2510955 RepID=UPI001039564F|nr:MsnO8 family LLM class oxidoreductase [Exiguobacterium sp. SH3S1]TCI62121.1 MsnO8 family LLM class oxidoreductase [Exiguobacterium sp. SH3S1]